MSDIGFIDEPVLVEVNGKVGIKAWVYEDDAWVFRELTAKECQAYRDLLNSHRGK